MNERDIFIAALEMATAEERSEFLSATCGGDSQLRERVEGLLQTHEQTGDFLQKPLVERLAEGVAALEEAAETARDPSLSRKGGDDLGFLSPSDQPGSLGKVGHYEVQEVIGRGGMGIVLRAFDERLHRMVAIKVMAATLATNAAARKRFQREARAAAAVCHDHIVTIHAVEESDEVPYLVMQCVSGLSLQQRIDRDGPLALHEILRIGMQTAAGLAAAHAQGLIHRDIKPANILLENGVERVKITDFGLARAAADASISQSGIVAGTPQYMAPEQARGEALDGRTDLFSLGSVLYAMCTGRAPFRATNSIAVLKRVCEEAPSPIREANADIPDWLVVLIDKLHAKNPDDRYQSAAEVAELLAQRLARLQNSTALPPMVTLRPPPARAAGPGWRRWAFAAAAVLVLAASFGLAEGTGATKFTATVIRLLTPEGTLVVEVTDPGVKVTIDGDGGLVITGVGQHEVRLKLGPHTLQADKNGQPVPLDQELVTITRGDKPVVRVRLEHAASVVVVPKGEHGAFVLLGGKGVAERKFDTLAEAVIAATEGDTIEIRGNGPFVTDAVALGQTALTIRAGDGFRPVIRLSPKGAQGNDALFATGASLVLEGLELQRHCPKEHMFPRPSLVSTYGSLRAANCRFFVTGARWQACVLSLSRHVALANCEFICPGSIGVSSITSNDRKLILDNCVHVGMNVDAMTYDGAPPEGSDVFVERCTLVSTHGDAAITVAFFRASDGDAPVVKKVCVQATGSVFATPTAMRFWQTPEHIEKSKLLGLGELEDLLPRLFSWHDRGNVYGTSAASLVWDAPGILIGTTLGKPADWKQYWGDADGDLSEGIIRLQGGNLTERAATEAEKITPEDFRLRPDSAGYKAGKDGKDLGADVDLVGPGPAYERWKKTPEYQEWLKETKQISAEAPNPEPQAFVVLGGPGVEERKFDTLADAVLAANDGDTIEIRGNGPFATPPLMIGKIGLSIRAGSSYRPILQCFYSDPKPFPGYQFFVTQGPLTLEGLEFHFARPDPNKEPGVLIGSGPTLHVANCTFRLPDHSAWNWDVGHTKVCVVRNCAFYNPYQPFSSSTLSGHPVAGFRGVIDNCLMFGHITDFHFGPALPEASLRVSRTTHIGFCANRFHVETWPNAAADPSARWCRLDMSSNILGPGWITETFQDKLALTDGKPLVGAQLEERLRRLVSWRGEQNLYTADPDQDRKERFQFFNGADGVQDWRDGPSDLDAWRKFWESPETGSIVGPVRFEGGNLIGRADTAPQKLTPEDFRLRPDSAGYRAGRDGKDLGADVDLVGPGPAYERWKKTTEYQQWLKESGQQN